MELPVLECASLILKRVQQQPKKCVKFTIALSPLRSWFPFWNQDLSFYIINKFMFKISIWLTVLVNHSLRFKDCSTNRTP